MGSNRSRPLHGESIYLRHNNVRFKRKSSSSRPLHGESIYLRFTLNGEEYEILSSRPLHGESIYLHRCIYFSEITGHKFSSPPRGIYIST